MGSRESLASLVWSEITVSGRTQADVCAAVGITQKHLSKFVNGAAGMSLDLVDAVLAEVGRELVLSTRVRTVEPDPVFCIRCGHACAHTPPHPLVDSPDGPVCEDEAWCTQLRHAAAVEQPAGGDA